MEYTKEQIDKLEELLYERAVDGNDDISHHAITYINELKKQLKLYSVSQQRELLLDFLSKVNGNLIVHPHLQMNSDFVDDYLKSNNCG